MRLLNTLQATIVNTAVFRRRPAYPNYHIDTYVSYVYNTAMTYPIKYHHSNGRNRDMDWLRQFLFTGLTQQQLAHNYGYARHYISYIVRRTAKYIAESAETAGLAATCATFDLTPSQVYDI